MKLLIMSLILSSQVFAKDNLTCSATEKVIKTDVVHNVNKAQPKHLKGATVTITKADGTSETVSSEKFMLVKRKQYTKVAENKVVIREVKCESNCKVKKNTIMLEGRNDIKDLSTKTSSIVNGQQANIKANTGLVLGLSYYRREVLNTPIGLGVGLDTNSTLKGMIGFDF